LEGDFVQKNLEKSGFFERVLFQLRSAVFVWNESTRCSLVSKARMWDNLRGFRSASRQLAWIKLQPALLFDGERRLLCLFL